MGKSEIQTLKRVDLTGQRFGRLTVERRSGKRRYWDCLCDCGNLISTQDTKLKTGHTRSCGCIRQTKSDFRVGSKVGELELIKKLPHRAGNRNGAYWQCRCSCGRLIERSSYQLRSNIHHNCRSLLHRQGNRIYPPTPTPYPEAAASIAKKYLHLAKTLNQGMAEDIATAAILRGAWICHWRQTEGFPIGNEPGYFAKIIKMAIVQEKRRIANEFLGRSDTINPDIRIGGSMTDTTYNDYPVADNAETQGKLSLPIRTKKFKRC